jgi:hypothetical protein
LATATWHLSFRAAASAALNWGRRSSASAPFELFGDFEGFGLSELCKRLALGFDHVRDLYNAVGVVVNSRLTSTSVRYSRSARVGFGRHLGVTVRLSVTCVIDRRWDLAEVFALLRRITVRALTQIRTVCNRRREQTLDPSAQWVPFGLPPTVLTRSAGAISKNRHLKPRPPPG